MSQTHFACGCIEIDGTRVVGDCTEGHVSAETPAELPTEPEPEDEDATPETPAETKRIAEGAAALARGEDPKDTRTAAEKKSDKKAAKG
jgi:hypothetical protein